MRRPESQSTERGFLAIPPVLASFSSRPGHGPCGTQRRILSRTARPPRRGRLQRDGLDPAVLLPALGAVVGCDRLLVAVAHRLDAVRGDSLGDEIVANRVRPLLRQLLVDRLVSNVVG